MRFISRYLLATAWLVALTLLVAACGDDGDVGAGEETDGEDVEAGDEDAEGEPDYSEAFSDDDAITLITATNPGGGYDFQLRTLQPYYEEELRELTGTNVSVLVENVPGAGQLIGYEEMSRAEPDGTTLALVGHELAAGMQVIRDATFDIRDWTYIGGVGQTWKGIMIPADMDLEDRSFEGLIERSQEQPLLWGHAGAITDFVIMRELLREEGVELQVDEILFEGTSDMVAASLRGDVEVVWTTLATISGYEEENPEELEIIGTTACESQPSHPDLPTIVDEGIPNAEDICQLADGGSRAIVGPEGIPDDAANALREALDQALENPDLIAAYEDAGHEVVPQSPQDLESVSELLLETYERYQTQLEEAEAE